MTYFLPFSACAASGLTEGKSIVSFIDMLLVKIMASLSIDMPIPAVGGIPYSIASRK